jgi:hypothetical protein
MNRIEPHRGLNMLRPMTRTSGSRTHDRADVAGPLRWILLMCLSCLAFAVLGEDEDWPDMDLKERIASVSDGDLRFVSPERAARSHRHVNHIRIDSRSLAEGWIQLTQCHENIDAVRAAQILFNAETIRDLEVVSSERIGRAWVDGHSVQLTDISPEAKLCIRGETRALFPLGEGRYRLRNGPYMRRFLDGYYPMQVALNVSYPEDRLALVDHQPTSQPGFEVRAASGHVAVDAAFEGRLFTCLDFCEIGYADCEMAASDCSE